VFEFLKRLFSDKNAGGGHAGHSSRTSSFNKNRTSIKPPSKSKYSVASCQSPGFARAHNEDTLFVLSSFLDGMDSSVFFGLYLVGDGMGGHQSGEVASSLAAKGASQFLIEHLFDSHLFDRESISDLDLQHLLKKAVDEAQNLILQRVPGGGTTLTLVMAVGDRLFSAHVGDSRLYLMGLDGKMTLKTRDHSLVKRLVDLGEITEYEAGTHAQKNVLYRALGQTDPFEPDIGQFSMEKGERLLICSDGLWGVLSEQRITEICDHASDLHEMACALVEAANQAGGPDNISVILVELLI
jgi:PPM family protein phosphatase